MMTVVTACWIALAMVAIATWVYATIASYREDDTVHLGAGEEVEVDRQIKAESRMKTIDHWKMMLTWVTVVGGVVVLGLYIYQGLVHGSEAFK